MSPTNNNLESRVSVLEDRMMHLRASQTAMGGKIDILYERYIEQRGGWKMAVAIGTALMTAGGILGGVAVKVWPLVFRVVA